MTIDYTKRGLRLGYILRGRYHDRDGTAQALRLCGPSSRTGTGLTLADPDDPATWPTRYYWRCGVAGVSLVDDIGKLDQHIEIPGTLEVRIPTTYPAEPDSRVDATDHDATLRGHIVSGRWANKDVDVWIVDLDTGDTEHKFRGRWDRDPDSMPGSGIFRLAAKESPSVLAAPWKVTTMPQDTSGYTDDGAQNSSGMFIAPTVLFAGRGYILAPDKRGAKVGCVFGYNDAVGNSTPAPAWREVVCYGVNQGTGNPSPPSGNTTDPALWFHVSPQYGCGVGAIRLVGDDGTVIQTSTSIAVGHNYDSSRGPLGTFAVVQVSTAQGANFNPTTANNKAFARIHGPSANPTAVEWDATLGEPYTSLSGFAAATPVVEKVEDILELIVEDPDYLGASSLLGTNAIADFAAGNPSGVAEYGEYLAAVPVEVDDKTSMTYRDALSSLVGGLPADLVWRYDSAAKERRLYPWWRVPQASTTDADHEVYPSDLVSSQPVSLRQMQDPHGEYANDVTVLAPEYIDQPSSLPIADAALLESRSRNSQRISNIVEQVAAKAGTEPIAGERSWKYWSPHSRTTGAEHSRFVAAEKSQPQVWTEGEIGGRLAFAMQIGDTIRYHVHGITSAIGMIRRLDYDVEAQTVTVHAIHVVFYDTTDVGGGD